MIKLLTDAVLIITGFQLIVLAVVLLAQKTSNRFNRNLLVAFLLTKAFLMVRWFCFRFEILSYDNYIYLYHISKSGFFLLAPLLYFYIRSLCYKDFFFKKADLMHSILFLIIIIFNIISVKTLVQGRNNLSYQIFVVHHNQIFWTLNLAQILYYIIAMLETIYHYQKKIKNIFSSIETINLNWVVSLLILISLHWLFVASRATLVVLKLTEGKLIQIIDLYSITIFLVFTTVLVFKGIAQLKIFTGIEGKSKPTDSKLPESEIQQYVKKLTNFMSKEKPYLEPSLTINDLSEQLRIPSWHLSHVINFAFNQNFFNFINSYRIEEVKRQLKSSANKRTVLEILYEAGFNSKSTFNSVFKKYTGMTPTEFKQTGQN